MLILNFKFKFFILKLLDEKLSENIFEEKTTGKHTIGKGYLEQQKILKKEDLLSKSVYKQAIGRIYKRLRK